ncbi:MAG: hypothetical protein JW784_03825 [Candidatus Cloacimonetes bacterium]|nr:hypothetical protein [Candidatus Cloacimonadota bacterium]
MKKRGKNSGRITGRAVSLPAPGRIYFHGEKISGRRVDTGSNRNQEKEVFAILPGRIGGSESYIAGNLLYLTKNRNIYCAFTPFGQVFVLTKI